MILKEFNVKIENLFDIFVYFYYTGIITFYKKIYNYGRPEIAFTSTCRATK